MFLLTVTSLWGEIGTSHYSGELFILGADGNDTDEYDGHVMIHEWGHYFEDKFSRLDSIGGPNSGGQSLDMRVAFSEGWGTALPAMVTDDSSYRDTHSARNESGFEINVDDNNVVNEDWYNEGSVQSILYDLYDADSDEQDNVALGFGPIYEVMVNAQKDTPALTSIFSFITALKAANPGSVTGIDALLTRQSIVGGGIDAYGATETNDAGSGDVLPVYTELSLGSTVNVCTLDTFGVYNSLSNRRFVRFTLDSTGDYTVTVRPTDGASMDAGFCLRQRGEPVLGLEDVNGDENTGGPFDNVLEGETETAQGRLAAGTYIVEVFDYTVLLSQAVGKHCFDVSLSR